MTEQEAANEATNHKQVVHLGRLLFEFISELDWTRYARERYAASGVATIDTVAIDDRGRICTTGLHFMAIYGAAYPIRVYAIRDEPRARGSGGDHGG